MKIALCMPTKDGRPFFRAAACLFRDQLRLSMDGHEVEMVVIEGQSLPTYARNECVHRARKWGADVIVQADDDTVWDGALIARILANMGEHPELRFVAAAIPYKLEGPVQWNINWRPSPQILCHGPTKYIEAERIGGALTVIQASVFDEMEAWLTQKDPSYKHQRREDEDFRVAFYECPVAWGEDMKFCDHWRAMGGRIWIDPEASVEHLIAPNWSVRANLADWLRERQQGGMEAREEFLAEDLRRVCVIFPTRANRAGAERTIASAIATASKPEHLRIIVGIDDDDLLSMAPEYLRQKFHPHVYDLIAPRYPTLGALFDALFAKADGDIILQCTDDVTFETPGWDDILRAQVKDGAIYTASIEGVNPDMVAAPIMSRAMADKIRAAQGFVNPPYFPYWFSDVWFADVCDLMGRPTAARTLPIMLAMPEGHSPGAVRELGFWASVYEALAPRRARTAAALMGVAHNEAAVETLTKQAFMLNGRINPMRTPEVQAHWEGKADGAPNARYAEARATAEALLAEKAA